MSWMNGAFRRVDENTEYLRQNGIPEWDNNLTYPAGAIAKVGSDFYLSKTESVDQAPTTSDNWEKLFFKADELNKKYLQSANALSEFSDLGLVSDVLQNLGLGDLLNFGENWFKLPSGHIVQMFTGLVRGTDANGTQIPFPISFPNKMIAISAMWTDTSTTAGPTFKVVGTYSNNNYVAIKASGTGQYGTLIIAIGI